MKILKMICVDWMWDKLFKNLLWFGIPAIVIFLGVIGIWQFYFMGIVPSQGQQIIFWFLVILPTWWWVMYWIRKRKAKKSFKKGKKDLLKSGVDPSNML